MKMKILLFIILIGVGWKARGQMNLGDAVVTKSQYNTATQVVEYYSVGNSSTSPPVYGVAPFGDNLSLPANTQPNWTANILGQVFGLAINTKSASGGQNPLIYTSVSQMYPPIVPEPTYQGGAWKQYIQNPSSGGTIPPTPITVQSAENATLIWELNPTPGVLQDHTSLVRLTHNEAFVPNTPLIFNLGSGLGNICFDPDHNGGQIFATNFEDGRIYRIAANPNNLATYGNVLSRYDPFQPFTCPVGGCATANPKFVERGERLWGIAYNHVQNRIYYSVWGGDYELPGNGLNPIYSVPLDGSGEFAAGTGGPNWTDPTPTPTVPVIPSPIILPTVDANTNYPPVNVLEYSNPISDIEFNEAGNIMMVAEKSVGLHGPTPPSYSITGTYGLFNLGWVHRSRVLSYTWNTGTTTWDPTSLPTSSGAWIIGIWRSLRHANQYYVGNAHYNLNHQPGTYDPWEYYGNNAAGGTDFGYEKVSLPQVCERLVWATGDALETPLVNPCYGFQGGGNTNEYLYGLAGMPINGNTYYDCPYFASSSVEQSSLYQNIFGGVTDAFAAKDYSGDVDVFRSVCCNLDIQGVATNVTCHGACTGAIGLTVTGGTTPYRYIWSNGATTEDLTGLCAGTYTVTVNPMCECSATLSFTITQPDAIVVTGTTVCACSGHSSGSVDITVTGGIVPYTYLWMPGGATTEDLIDVGPGNYCVTITDANMCTVSACFSVADCSCDAEITLSDLTPCSVQTITVDATGSTGPYVGIYFDMVPFTLADFAYLGSTSGASFPVTIPPDALGTHRVCVRVYTTLPTTDGQISDYCIPAEKCVPFDVSYCGCPAPEDYVPAVSFNPDPPTGLTYNFYNSGAQGMYINWTITDLSNNTTVATGQTVDNDNNNDGVRDDDPFTHVFTDPGTYNVCMEVTLLLPDENQNMHCCVYTVCREITITQCDIWKENDAMTVTFDPNDYLTIHQTFHTSPLDGSHEFTVIWTYGDGSDPVITDGSAPPAHSFDHTGTFHVCAYAVWSAGPLGEQDPEVCCCFDDVCENITINQCDNKSFEIQLIGQNQTSTDFQIVPMPIGATSITWPSPFTADPTGQFGSTNQTSGTLDFCVDVRYPDPQDPDGCSVCAHGVFDLGGAEGGSRLINYFPNPTTGKVLIAIGAKQSEKAFIQITDYLGQPMISKSFESLAEGKNSLYINLAGLIAGVYQMKVTVGNETKVVKVVKQ